MENKEESRSSNDKQLKTLNTFKNPCLIRILDQMYQNRNKTGDVKFIVESEEILAHRNVLAALSPKYDAQFYGSQPDSGDIKVEGVSAAAFNEFLQFFYTEDVTLTIENIEDVLNLAEQSLAKNLVKMCSTFLMNTVELGRIGAYLRLARLYNLKKLQEKCDDIISVNIHKVFISSDFYEYDRDTLIYILKLDTWNCKEVEVFVSCMAWARAECKRQNIDDTKTMNLRNALGDAFFAIRFGLMTIEDLAYIDHHRPDLFTKTELSECLHKIAKINPFDSSRCNPRAPQIERTFEHCKATRDSGESFVPDYVEGDMLEFRCDEPIDLYGFIMSASPCDDFRVDIHDGNERLKNYPKTIEKTNESFQILFKKPVQILPDQKYMSDILIYFPESVSQLGCIPLPNATQTGIKFIFELQGGCSRTTIRELLFKHSKFDNP